MRKLPLLLLSLAIISCVHREKPPFLSDQTETDNSLSLITQKITAIPLETNPQCILTELKQVKTAQSNIFVLSGNDIFRFNRSGSFINKISIGKHTRVNNFTIDADDQHIIVLDSLSMLHYYTFDGVLLVTKDAEIALFGGTILDLAYYDHFLWALTENISADNAFEKWLYKLNPAFRPIKGVRLSAIDLGRFYLDAGFSAEICVADHMVYVYTPFSYKQTLLRDTLYLLSDDRLNQERLSSFKETGHVFSAYSIPFRLGKRYMLASYQTHASANANYLYCYDRKTNKSLDLNGLNDDFFHTGIVKDLRPADLYNNEYYFFKSGNDILSAFPERDENANPVLFFIQLHG